MDLKSPPDIPSLIKSLRKPRLTVRWSIGAPEKTSAIDTVWIILPTAEKSAAKVKNGDNPMNAAPDGRGFINGAVFF